MPPPYSLDELAEGDPERQLDDAAAGDVAGQLEHLGAARAADAELGVRRAAVGQDHRDRAQREHVVDDRRAAEQPFDRGDRRLGAHLAALALEAVEHRGLLAADVGAGAHPHVEVEGEPGAEDVLAEPAVRVRRVDRRVERGDRVGVLRAHVDVALGRRRRRTPRSSCPR